jgi:Ni/Co efflux regulator RcnB
MRKLLLSILLASAAATPALADPPTREEREQARQERQQAREDRQQSRSERAQPRQQSVQPTARMQTIQPANIPPARDRADARRQDRIQTRDQRFDQRQQLRQDRTEARDQRFDERQQLRQDRIETRQVRQAARTPVVSTTPRPGTQPPLRVDNRRSSTPRWNTSWKNNNKYDWHGWRKRHRSLFHLGFYFDPFGWGYQRYNVGWRLYPNYYSSNYWLNDPSMYALPYAPYPYKWVRYYDDALLVNTFTGQVVDVMYDFFW